MKHWLLALTFIINLTAASAQDPGAAQDALAERQRILRAADQLELLIRQNARLTEQLATLTERVLKLESAGEELQAQLARQQRDWAADREKLLKEVARLIAAGGKATPPAAPPPPAATRQETGFWYDVQAGQSLWAIADAYQKSGVNVSVNDIRQANNLKDDTLQIGQRLFIPKK
ncbi:MAG: LysM peptidoglycan-binding domain-containing protein [Verrucomicrobiales bacterium]|jgi:LysM repeat protein|nr:LysM peptidoglycan-binding domain-containing protein [Verrucomicrobiales bacterium]